MKRLFGIRDFKSQDYDGSRICKGNIVNSEKMEKYSFISPIKRKIVR